MAGLQFHCVGCECLRKTVVASSLNVCRQSCSGICLSAFSACDSTGPERLHRRHPPRVLGGHVAGGGIERSVAGVLPDRLQRRTGGERVGDVGVPHPVGTCRGQPCRAAGIGRLELSGTRLEKPLDLPVQGGGGQPRVGAGRIGVALISVQCATVRKPSSDAGAHA